MSWCLDISARVVMFLRLLKHAIIGGFCPHFKRESCRRPTKTLWFSRRIARVRSRLVDGKERKRQEPSYAESSPWVGGPMSFFSPPLLSVLTAVIDPSCTVLPSHSFSFQTIGCVSAVGEADEGSALTLSIKRRKQGNFKRFCIASASDTTARMPSLTYQREKKTWIKKMKEAFLFIFFRLDITRSLFILLLICPGIPLFMGVLAEVGWITMDDGTPLHQMAAAAVSIIALVSGLVFYAYTYRKWGPFLSNLKLDLHIIQSVRTSEWFQSSFIS